MYAKTNINKANILLVQFSFLVYGYTLFISDFISDKEKIVYLPGFFNIKKPLHNIDIRFFTV